MDICHGNYRWVRLLSCGVPLNVHVVAVLLHRWISLGAFYTFSRDHSSINTAPQELYRWPATITAARKALGMRYRLLPYLYSSFYIAHTAGGTVAKPLFMLDPADAAAR